MLDGLEARKRRGWLWLAVSLTHTQGNRRARALRHGQAATMDWTTVNVKGLGLGCKLAPVINFFGSRQIL